MIQNQVLSKIILDKDMSIITLNNLNVDYFSSYKNEFNFILNHYNKYGNVCDAETFLSTFDKFELTEVKEPTSYLLEELVKDRNIRYLTENYNKMRNFVVNGDAEGAFEIVKEASEKIGTCVSLNATNILEDKTRYDKYIEKTSNPTKYFIKTGFKELDEALGGGWDIHEELACIVARTGIGKTWCLLKCATAASKQGLRVGIYSGEMSADKVGYRFDTLASHINNGAITHGGASVKNEYREYITNLEEKGYGPVFVLTPQDINGPATISALRAFVEKYNLDILFVDQYSLLEDEKGAKRSDEKIANISKGLKLLQVTKQMPIIAVSQQNREKNEDGTQDTTQVAGSDRIGQDATVMIFLSKKEGVLTLYLAKARDGGEGFFNYRIDFNTGYFEYVPEEGSLSDSDNNGINEYQEYSEDEVF